MHLKSLTIKGFKSFAAPTTLNFETGITAVVGPNGSGKSNVVDAIAWVLGEQGAKALRGGKMDDVIFAGTADRPPLGRAEVTLTIDNSDGALPIEYAEVSITRRMFRDGAGEYEINGRACRLLDIQELLSDSGIGRELHVIVGQGQLDAVLQARPEDRRAFIEEAAGVLKHRKRKEKALRKLDSMQTNLTRLTDLTGELRRQLKPLGRQAEVARRAAGVQAELRDARARLLADELIALRVEIEQESRDEERALAHRTRVQCDLAETTRLAETATATAAAAGAESAAAGQTWFELSALAERFAGTVSLARERRRNLSEPLRWQHSDSDPAELDAAADQAEREQVDKDRQVAAARTGLQAATERRRAADAELAEVDRTIAGRRRAVADRREGLARLGGQVETARSRLAAAEGEAARLAAAIADARDREQAARVELAALQDSAGELDSSEVGLDDDYQRASNALASTEARLADIAEALTVARTRRTELQARSDALSLLLDFGGGAGALLTEPDDGRIGAVAELLTVAPGYEAAVTSALGLLADAVAVRTPADAARAMAQLRAQDQGRASLLIKSAAATDAAVPTGRAWPGVRRVVEQVTGPADLLPALRLALADCMVVDTMDQALALVAQHPSWTAVTRAGDLLAAGWAAGGSADRSALQIRAERDQSDTELSALATSIAALEDEQDQVGGAAVRCRADADRALSALHESDAQLAAVSEQLGRLAAAGRSAGDEADRLDRRRAEVQSAIGRHRQDADSLEERLRAAGEQADGSDEVDTTERDRIAAGLALVQHQEMDARLAVRTAEERAAATAGTADRLRRNAANLRSAQLAARAAAVRRATSAELAAAVLRAADLAVGRLDSSVQSAAQRRDAAAHRVAAADRVLAEARTTMSRLQQEWDALTDTVHRDEVLRAEQAVRLQQLCDRAVQEFAMTADDLAAEFGPEVPVPPAAAELAEYQAAKDRGEPVSKPMPIPYDRDTQQRRARRAERDLNLLGKVNPLALEEFAALQERHAFLSTQLEDLKSTRRDLLTVVGEVDQKILELFTAAYHDVAREFITVFASLFPGGAGELVLTDPGDMLATGIEVNARPPGKKVKRLSLLSGGERSLTAVAMLVAIFRARPSPFYVLDEVEAALDEVNLGRLVGLLTELRESSQLIVVTHQRFTMEAADALYGVSMRGDGISQVISQRIRDGADRRPPAAGSDAVEDREAVAAGTTTG